MGNLLFFIFTEFIHIFIYFIYILIEFIENHLIDLIIFLLIAFSIAYSKEDWLTEVIVLLLLALLIAYISLLAMDIIGFHGFSLIPLIVKQFAILQQQQNISTNINITIEIDTLSHDLKASYALYDFIDSHILYEIVNHILEYLTAVIFVMIGYIIYKTI
jgi:hypothetical protein